MRYFISLAGIPNWALSELLQNISQKKLDENLDLKIPDYNSEVFADFPTELLIEGSKVALTVLIPFIYDWLVKKRIKCEIKMEDGKEIITISGYGISKLIKIKEGMMKQDEPKKTD